MPALRPRIFGMETEYCVVLIGPSGKIFNPVYRTDSILRPLRDIFELPYAEQDTFFQRFLVPSLTKNNFWIGATGGLLYGDCSGEVIEYATPECATVRSVAGADKGGEHLLCLVRDMLRQKYFADLDLNRRIGVKDVLIFKNNSSCIFGTELKKSTFWGSHENYEMPVGVLSTSDLVYQPRISRAFISFFAVRQLFAGGGGLVKERGRWKYVISPRALHTSDVLSAKNGIITFKSEGECKSDERIRLQISVGDSTMMESIIRMRFALTHAFFRMCECRGSFRSAFEFPVFEDPFTALHEFSRDPALTVKMPLYDRARGSRTIGETLSEWIEIMMHWNESACVLEPDVMEELCAAYGLAQSALKHGPDALVRSTDWGLKYDLLKKYCARHKIKFQNYKARLFDAWFSEIGPSGIYNRVCEENPFSPEELDRTIWHHTADARAELRKQYLSTLARHDIQLSAQIWGRFYPPRLDGITDGMPSGVSVDTGETSEVIKEYMRLVEGAYLEKED